MDVEGHFSSFFNIKNQSFGEQFKVVLDVSVSVLDKNGDLTGIVSSKLVSNWVLAEENIKPKISKGLDIRHLVIDPKTEKESGSERNGKRLQENEKDSGLSDVINTNKRGTPTENETCFFSNDRIARLSLVLELESFQIKACNDTRSNLLDSEDTLSHKSSKPNRSIQNNVREFIDKNKCRKESSDIVALSENKNARCISETREIQGFNDENETAGYNDETRESEKGSSLTMVDENNSNKTCYNNMPALWVTKDNKAQAIEALEMQVYQSDGESASENNDTDNENGYETKHQRPPVLEIKTEIPPITKNDNSFSISDTNSDIKVEQASSHEETNEIDDTDRRYPRRTRRKIRSQNLQNYYVNDEILQEDILLNDEDSDDDDYGRKSKKKKVTSKAHQDDADYMPSDEVQSEKSDTEDQPLSNEECELENEESANCVEKQDLTKNQIAKYKKILRDQGQESKIPEEEIDSRVLMAKLKLEVKLLRRIKVTLADHTDKFEMKTFTSNEQKHRKTKVEEKSHDSFVCKICDAFQTGLEEDMRVHIEQHLNGDLKCKWCGIELAFLGERQVHYKTHHPDQYGKKFRDHHFRICEMCGQKCREGQEWKRHMYTVHDVPSFECRFCPEKLPSQKKYTAHMKNVHSEQLYKCEKCDRRFIEHGTWTYHTIRCEGDMPASSTNTCHLCGTTLSSISILRRHIRGTHHKEKLHKCTLCSYSFFGIGKLKKHMDAHLGIKKYKCTVCDFATVQSYQLTSHMRIHTKEKPFRCDKCTYASAWNVQLKTHKKVHDLDNTVTCDCGIVVKNTQALNRHKKRDHAGHDDSDQ